MKHSFAKSLKHISFSFVWIALAIVIVSILMQGMPLFGAPKASSVASVTITDPALTSEAKEVSDPELIKHSCQLFGFLRYCPFAKANAEDTPLITMTFTLTDGGTATVSASRETVWWKEKAYVLREPEFFINLAEGIFFSEEAA